MKTLGVVLAGGRSRRFGSDKAEAMLEGHRLLDHALAAMSAHCEQVAVVGRVQAKVLSIADRPGPGLGPLGGLAGALHYALAHGFDRVLSAPVDCTMLPPDIIALLQPAPAFLEGSPVIGLWPASAYDAVAQMLRDGGDRSVRAFARAIGARAVRCDVMPPNINTREDLAELTRHLAEGGG